MVKLSQIDNYHLITGRTTLLLNRFLTQRFKEAGIPITREQWTILAILWIEDGSTQQYLAQKTYRDKPSTTRLIDNLEREGLVVRRSDEKDKRINHIFLTEKAKALEEPVNDLVYETLEIATKGLTYDEATIIKSAFDKVYHNIMDLLK
jgi:DNA-binding MarR family transcriptional regulator